MFSRRHVALAIAALLIASLAFAAEKEAKKKPKKVSPRPRAVAPAFDLAFVRVLPPGYTADRRVSLLRNPKVQEDLKLDEKQTAAIEKTFEEITAKRRGLYAPIPGITPQERAKIIAEARKDLQKYTAEQNKKLLAVLTDAQREQFKKMAGEKLDLPRRQGGRRGGGQRA